MLCIIVILFIFVRFDCTQSGIEIAFLFEQLYLPHNRVFICLIFNEPLNGCRQAALQC